jgi:hypothetical protein
MTPTSRRSFATLVLSVTVLGVTTAAAQSPTPPPTPTPAPAAPSPKLFGAWEGTYATDGPSGTMSLTLAAAGDTVTVTAALDANAPAPGEARDVKASGATVTWVQAYGEYEVVFKGTLSEDGAQITGTIEASQGGSYVGGGSFTLTRKA